MLSEHSIRLFTAGRNNWFQIDTAGGAKASAIAYNIAGTAKANRRKSYEYFRYLLEELPRHGVLEERFYVEQLLPWSETEGVLLPLLLFIWVLMPGLVAIYSIKPSAGFLFL